MPPASDTKPKSPPRL